MSMYQDDRIAAAEHRDRLLRETAARAKPQYLSTLYAVRMARVVGSLVALGGFVVLLLDLLGGAGNASLLLGGTVAAAAASIPLVLLLCRRAFAAEVARWLRPTADPFADVQRITSDPRTAPGPIGRLHRLELPSFVLPVAALSLLTPLTLHLLFGGLFLGVSAHDFSKWIAISLLLVGHAHLAVLIQGVLHVRRVCRSGRAPVDGSGIRCGVVALLVTTVVAAVPWAMLLFIPPVLVAVTGATFVPWMFHWVSVRVFEERWLLSRGLGSCCQPR